MTIKERDGYIAIYYEVRAGEDFETAAHGLWDLVRTAAERYPAQKRRLYLDIDGHRNSKGGFDRDMHDLQAHFIVEFLSAYLSAVYLPLTEADLLEAGHEQSDDLPGELTIETLRGEGNGD